MSMRGTSKRWTDNTGALSTAGRTSSTSQAMSISAAPAATAGLYWRDDLINLLQSSFVATGAASVASFNAEAGHPGVISLSMAATTDGERIFNGASLPSIILTGGGPIHFETEVAVTTLSNGVDNIVVRAGLLDCATALVLPTDSVHIEYDLAGNGNGNWWLVTTSNGTRTAADTGTAVVANTYQRLEFDINAAATLVNCAIGGVAKAASSSTNIPSGAGRQTGLMLVANKQLGTGALTVRFDYYEFAQTFTTARS
jgi:hypothetical protein